MKNPEYQLYWEDIGERMIYAELDDYTWKLAEKMFGYAKQRSMYIYHHGRLAAFYSKEDIKKETRAGYLFYIKKRNQEKIIKLKRQALGDARQHIRDLKKYNIAKLSNIELTNELIKTLDAWRQALSVHFLSMPQFFYRFEELDIVHEYNFARIGKARFKTRIAFSELWQECRRLFREYAQRHGLTLEEAESIRYRELRQGARRKTILKKRANKFVLFSKQHTLRASTGKTVERYIRQYEQYANVHEASGTPGYPGKVRARAFVVKNENLDFENLPKGMKKGMALIMQNAWPELAQYFGKASAIVTNEGGIISHAVIVARELGIPCIVGTGIAAKIFKTGDMVEVDAENGIVKKVF